MKKDSELTMLEMLLKYKDNEEKAIELLDNYTIREIKEYYSNNNGNHYCKIIEAWSKANNVLLNTTSRELYEKLQDRIKVFDDDVLRIENRKR